MNVSTNVPHCPCCQLRRVISIRKVCQMLGVGHSTLYRWMARGLFPKPIPIGPELRGYLEHEVAAWLNERRQSELHSAFAPPKPFEPRLLLNSTTGKWSVGLPEARP